MRRVAVALLVIICVLTAQACQDAGRSTSAAPNPAGWIYGSQPVGDHVIATFSGPVHCDWQNTLFLIVSWPLGRSTPSYADMRWYVRSPDQLLWANYELSAFSDDVTPPADVAFTGFHNANLELWLAPSDQDQAAYLKTGDRFERWPLSRQALFCA